MQLTVDSYQFSPQVGNLDYNAGRIIQLYNESSADLVVFPELSLTGYNCQDLFLNNYFISSVEENISKIAKQIGEKGIIIGSPSFENGKLYNSALLIRNGQITDKYHKYFLPNYGVFNEKRYFESGDKLSSIFTFKGCKIRLMICEDIWYPQAKLSSDKEDCQLTITINGSPYSINKSRKRIEIIKNFSQKYNSEYVIYLNSVGVEDHLLFDGGSFIVKNGELIKVAKQWEEDKILLDLSNDNLDVLPTPDKSDSLNLSEETSKEIYNGIILALRSYSHYSSCSKFVIGLSGGIDSALVAVLAVEAFGPENVLCVAMPSEFSSSSSLYDAKELVKNLGCQLEIIPITDIKNTFTSCLKATLGRLDPNDLTNENIQPRIRSTLLMAIANNQNRLLLCTSNKSESAVGYTTLYGDMTGAYSPIADLYKTQVYSLSRWINKDKQIIPNSVIEKEPSAELKPNQKDSDSLPLYNVLDKILYSLIELNIAPKNDLSNKIQMMLYKSEFKRFQAPPTPKINSVTLSSDRRYPICIKF